MHKASKTIHSTPSHAALLCTTTCLCAACVKDLFTCQCRIPQNHCYHVQLTVSDMRETSTKCRIVQHCSKESLHWIPSPMLRTATGTTTHTHKTASCFTRKSVKKNPLDNESRSSTAQRNSQECVQRQISLVNSRWCSRAVHCISMYIYPG
jgi:hypothetical protein